MNCYAPFDCAECGRCIGEMSSHYAGNEEGCDIAKVVCRRCDGRIAHRALYPDCPVMWHDLWDHNTMRGNRKAIRLWFEQRALL